MIYLEILPQTHGIVRLCLSRFYSFQDNGLKLAEKYVYAGHVYEDHRTLIKFSLLELHTLDILRNDNKITHLSFFVQNNKSTKPNWQ